MAEPWKGAARPLAAGAFDAAAAQIGCETAALRAVWDVEAGGKGFLADGSLVRRFEPHLMPGATTTWRDSLKISAKRRERMFLEAFAVTPDAALRATSWGAPQIMGFNAQAAGFSGPRAMIMGMANDEGAHLSAFVALVRAWGLEPALRGKDWLRFARRWNGTGQPEVYAGRIEAAYRRHSGGKASPVVLRAGDRGPDVARLQRALGLPADGAFGSGTAAAVEEFQKRQGLPVDGVVGARTWEALHGAVGATPPTKRDRIEEITRAAGAATAVTGAVAGVAEVLPSEALMVLVYAGAAAAVLFAAAYAWRRARA